MEKVNAENQIQLKPFYDKVSEDADSIIRYFIIGYFIVGLLITPFYSSYGLGIGLGLLNLIIYFGTRIIGRGKLWQQIVTSLVLWNFALQFIIQMHGSYEMYFFYFISLTALLFYEDWKILLPQIIYAIATFVVLFGMRLKNSETIPGFENMDHLTGQNMVLHLVLIIFYGVLSAIWSTIQHRQTTQSALNQIEMNSQLALMDVNIQFANSISQGNLQTEYAADESDNLGRALEEMRQSLVEASEREAKEKFINVGLASIGEILRNNSDNLDQLCDEVIGTLVNYMKANQGGIFILNDDQNNSFLELKACRAYERKKFLEKRVEVGQGLVGQAAIENRTIYMTDIPQNYMNITSGLGLANPNSLLIVPLQSNEQLIGVIEMASFEVFDETDLEFLEKVGESIAATVISVQTNEQTKVLLEQSKQMTEEMRAQEEEMRQNMEEMQATQEEMARTQKELSDKEANLNALINNTSDSIITMDRNYKILIMNDVVKQRYKGTQYEGFQEGSDALEMLGDLRDKWKAYYDRAMKGEAINFTLESSVQGEDSWREYFINPIKDKNSNILGASVFSRDITSRRKLELELKSNQLILNSIINNNPNACYAIDQDYNILLANEAIKKQFKKFNLDLDVGDKIPAQGTWKEQYEKALNGEKVSFTEIEKHNKKESFLDVQITPVQDDSGKIVAAAIIAEDVTELKELQEKINKLSA